MVLTYMYTVDSWFIALCHVVALNRGRRGTLNSKHNNQERGKFGEEEHDTEGG